MTKKATKGAPVRRASQYVMVTTDKRGVFAGLLKKDAGGVVTLTEARNCVYWSQDVRGFLGLAAGGPTAGCRIGPSVPEMELCGVTAIVTCTDAGRKAWEAAP